MPIRQALQEKLLRPHFQPIVAVNEGRVVGYEALIRGPAELGLRDPMSLFGAAEREGLLRELERECWSVIVDEVSRNVDRIPRWARIFLNVLPEDILDALFLEHVTAEMERTRLDPARIVIEITESTRIEDYALFNRALSRYREMGFGIAVDDAGAGHAGLQMIAEINPDYLKIDQGLVRGIDRSIAKRAGVEALILLARALGMTVIAEGIENEEELRALHGLGIALGQGFLLAHPSLEMAAGVAPVPYQLRPMPLDSIEFEVHGGRGRIGDAALPAPTVSANTPLRALAQIFESRRGSDAAVVTDKGAPVGLIMRSALQLELARPYTSEKIDAFQVLHILGEHAPLVVDCDAQLDAVARLAMSRDDAQLYDHVVVVRDGKLVGTVSIQRLLDAVTDQRLFTAKYANPLTGLPGLPVLEEWVRDRLRHREQIALMHIDIDSLRIFNELYGFHQGDRAIRAAAQLLDAEVAARTAGHGQLGHVGGDDFIAVVDIESADDLSRRLPVLFRERVTRLYQAEDRSRGYVLRSADYGELRRIPLMSLTIASIHPVAGGHQHFAELLDSLADARRGARARSRSAQEAEIRRLLTPQLVPDERATAKGTSTTAA